MSFWNDIDLLTRVARYVPYLFIVLGFLVAISGQFARTIIDDRVKHLKSAVENERKRTPPQIDASLIKNESGEYFVVLKASNEIPFRASWMLITENNQVVSGVMLAMDEFHPSPGAREWTKKLTVLHDRVRGFVELSFQWESVYAAELNNPAGLSGSITKRYVEAIKPPPQK